MLRIYITKCIIIRHAFPSTNYTKITFPSKVIFHPPSNTNKIYKGTTREQSAKKMAGHRGSKRGQGGKKEKINKTWKKTSAMLNSDDGVLEWRYGSFFVRIAHLI